MLVSSSSITETMAVKMLLTKYYQSRQRDHNSASEAAAGRRTLVERLKAMERSSRPRKRPS